ncbi:MAG: FliM/FliN family flagellar motor switch protein [Pararhodobacter sp.]|nr:FliM/FliN family flagellar motor switch protein [Pararhodobacter sp.]
MERSERLTQAQPVLRRKLARKRVQPPAEGEGEAGASNPRAHPFERALARACAAIGGGLHASARLSAAREVGQAELLELVEPEGFLTLLAPAGAAGEDDAPDEAAAGLLALDRGAFMALVEILTTGRLSASARPPRRATPTDDALLCDFVDGLLLLRQQEFERQGSGAAGPSALAPWQRGRFVADARLLSVLLEEGAFTLEQLDITISLGREQRSGRLLLGLPVPAAAADVAGNDTGAGVGGGAPPAQQQEWQRRVEAMVMAVPTELRAVLGRVSLPLEEALQLVPDRCLTLPIGQLEEVRLESGDCRLLALARLGQYRGMRALRLTAMPEGAHMGPMLAGPALPPAPMPAPAMAQDDPLSANADTG